MQKFYKIPDDDRKKSCGWLVKDFHTFLWSVSESKKEEKNTENITREKKEAKIQRNKNSKTRPFFFNLYKVFFIVISPREIISRHQLIFF